MEPVTYNARTSARLQSIRKWSEENRIVPKVFETFDGGGLNGYIVEFDNFGDLQRFRQHFRIRGRIWVEDAEGKHHPLENFLEDPLNGNPRF
ncbi:hypothetical protein [Haloferula sp. A504]|uniref:hypothetical protein n=1 Tax=Haloferula sp. A504 TaxID=3373601 RepID=UPI0031C866E3|nr:hypothetical protein [Verrucomicrobiaceae bacterium E54]